jgi:hypothetical protein
MDTFSFYRGFSWVVCAFGRNPLVRGSDRAEAFLLLLAFVSVLVITPVAGAIGTAVHESHSRLYADQARARQPVAATVTGNPTSTIQAESVVIVAPVHWRVDGVDHAGELEVASAPKAGDRVQVWVDRSGHQVGPAPATSLAGTDALVAAAGFWLGMVASVAGLTALLRAGLARRRDSAWEREWQVLINDSGGRAGTQA